MSDCGKFIQVLLWQKEQKSVNLRKLLQKKCAILEAHYTSAVTMKYFLKSINNFTVVYLRIPLNLVTALGC